MTQDHDDITNEPDHTSSPTDHVLSELQLYGYRPHDGEPDTRGVPEDDHIARAVADIFDALIATFCDTSLDADLDEVLWSTVNTFHRAADRIARKLDDNEQAQRRLQSEQDGSEVKSVQLECLAEKPDLTMRALTAELAERGVRVAHDTVWRFVRRAGQTVKKRP